MLTKYNTISSHLKSISSSNKTQLNVQTEKVTKLTTDKTTSGSHVHPDRQNRDATMQCLPM